MHIVLRSLVTLLEQPNPDDPLMTDIAELYTTNHAKFVKTAKEHTKKVRGEALIVDRIIFCLAVV